LLENIQASIFFDLCAYLGTKENHVYFQTTSAMHIHIRRTLILFN